MTVSALAVTLSSGIQPILFSENGRALYSPYGLEAAFPAMLIAHIFGASIVEAIISALGIAYLQKSHPEYLTSLKNIFAGPGVVEGKSNSKPLGQIIAMTVAGGLVVLFAARTDSWRRRFRALLWR